MDASFQQWLAELLLLFGLGALFYYAFQRAKIGLVGLLLVGVVVNILGANGLRVIGSFDGLHRLAEIGVILLLFSLGIEFSLSRLIVLSRIVVAGGVAQMAITAMLSVPVAWALTGSLVEAAICGALTVMSSTVLGLRMLEHRGDLDTPQGNLSVAVLLFQDLSLLPLMLLLPFMAAKSGVENAGVVLLLQGAMVLFGIFAVCYWVLERLLDHVTRLRSQELFLLLLFVICLGTALASSISGLSPALGPFVAGLALSRSRYRFEMLGSAGPFRTLLGAIFFISVGTLLDVGTVAEHWTLILLGLPTRLGIKFVGALISAMLLGFPLRTSAISASILAPAGELSFVLALAATKIGLLPEAHCQLFLSVAVLSMLGSPFVVMLGYWLAEVLPDVSLPRIGRVLLPRAKSGHEARADHVVIIGYGAAGHLSSVLCLRNSVPFVVVEMNPATIRVLERDKFDYVYGDSRSPEVLKKAGVTRARAVVVTVNDNRTAEHTVSLLRALCPDTVILVRVPYRSNVSRMRKLGATEVVASDLAAGIVVAHELADALGVPPPSNTEVESLMSLLTKAISNA